MQDAWRKFIAGKDGRPVLYQRPNMPLICWAMFEVLSLIIRANSWHHLLSWLALVMAIVWALMEIFRGASYFRRSLGLVVLCVIIISRLW